MNTYESSKNLDEALLNSKKQREELISSSKSLIDIKVKNAQTNSLDVLVISAIKSLITTSAGIEDLVKNEKMFDPLLIY